MLNFCRINYHLRSDTTLGICFRLNFFLMLFVVFFYDELKFIVDFYHDKLFLIKVKLVTKVTTINNLLSIRLTTLKV